MNVPRRLPALIFLFVASVAYSASAAPAIDVIISERPSGKLAYKGKTDSRGYFEAGGLSAGSHTVQMRTSKSKEWAGSSLWIGVSGGRRLVTAKAIPGEKLGGGGLAMIVEVGRGSKITGQITTGKRMVWVPPQTGSNFPGHWVEHDSAERVSFYNRTYMSREDVMRVQEGD